MRIVGIDCATSDGKVGIAIGELGERLPVVTRVFLCGKPPRTAAESLLEILSGGGPTLLALDAPLGWPSALAEALAGHVAGEPISVDSNLLFRRETDRFVKKRIDQQPLDVGADRIARTAHWAVNLLADTRRASGLRIPLAWKPSEVVETMAIEVYPAATLRSIGIRPGSYKKRDERPARQHLVAALSSHALLENPSEAFLESADAIDAVVCLIAGAHFLRGEASPPTDLTAARREGWIWVREPPERSS